MTERGLPIVGGAPACPFVAFEDDRDERATSPDHRHRCFAEAQPAPRALAHQEAYCLSSAFPVCPTFQDWARREAARARPADVPPATFEDEEGEDDRPMVEERPPRRAKRDAWTAPPPWLRGSGSTGTAGPASGGMAGSFGRPTDEDEDQGAGPAGAAAGAGAAFAAGGLSGSFADRLVSDRGAVPGPPERVAPPPEDRWDEGIEPDEGEDEGLAAAPRRRRERIEAGSDRMEARDRDMGAPSWERPRRLEAYPTLRSRRWSTILPTVIAALVVILLIAAAFLFLPKLLGGLVPQAGASPTPSAAASAGPGQSAAPTVGPAATPQMYTVVAGDTLTKIAKKFGVSLNDLIAANQATLPDPNKLKIGDVLVIPTPGSSFVPGTSAGASP